MTETLNAAKPAELPADAHFSSGPTKKRPNWSATNLKTESLGRSHRSKLGKNRLALAIDLTREVLGVPADYRIGIVPASDTGAVEMSLWSMLGPKPVALLDFESFGAGWVTDVVKQLKVENKVFKAPYGELPNLAEIPTKTHDVVFTWNGTTSGVKVPNADWIADDREGLIICDATSAAFAQDLDYKKLDVVTLSWQKALGGEGGHGILILSPRAVERLETYTPAWPMPKIFRMTKGGKLIEGIFKGETINTPSMLAVEDYIDALEWAQSLGGFKGLMARADANLAAVEKWIAKTPWVENLAAVNETKSNTSVCLKVVDERVTKLDADGQAAFAKALSSVLEKEGAALDIGGYRDAPPGLRVWCGATVETSDVEALLPWLDWAFATEVAKLG
ncbi:phosphoserine transaminase [Pseudaquidulcibacter saccharophilus]|uniref:phosphoserine transaminase n=1 Tax=Pseudaquidulcibacter saccharophilus TaxID=2831900 RepID=UPI001EFEFFCC|nr:phosphoserine transaminase [Pseudaquidulcibacter saccharophilus]